MTASPQARPAGRSPALRAGQLARVAGRLLPPLAVVAAVLAVWELSTAGSGRHVIPPPSAILAALSTEGPLLQTSALATLYEALGGLAIGTIGGVAASFATSRWVTARDLLLPIAIGASAVPLIAIAPILNNWFGVLDPLSKMMMAALLVFFPITVNVTRGLVQVDPSALELMRSYASGDWEVLRRVRIPNMLPFFFTALKVSTTLAFIGAIVGEFYGGTSEVLGRVVLTSISGGSFDVAWAAILLGSLAAIACYVTVTLVERAAIPWYAALRSGPG
jgi:NitT/TauT family transport system permease protein